MAKLILIQEDDYMRQYRESMNYLHSKYHDQPTKLKNMPSFDDWMITNYGENINFDLHSNIPIGKLVI
jgi:hypothetical protein